MSQENISGAAQVFEQNQQGRHVIFQLNRKRCILCVFYQ